MRRCRVSTLTATGLLTALILLPAGATLALPLAAQGDDWIRVDTAHLVLFSNASRDATVEIGRQMELYRSVLARLGPSLSADSPLPTSVYVFKNELTFSPYKLRQKGRHAGLPANLDGFFVQDRDGNYIGVNATPDSSPWPVIYHEYFHFFLNNNFGDIPIWFNEGMAQCYSTFRIEGSHVEIGGPIPEQVRWLRAHPLMPFARLEQITFDSPEYHESGAQQTFYAQSWVMAHYLLWGPARQSESGVSFLHDLKRGDSLETALAPLTSSKDPALAQHVADYARKGRFASSQIELGTLRYDDTARVTPMSRAEMLYRLGDFLLHSETDRVRDAEEHLREAIRLEPGHAAAHADLGMALEQRKQYAEAHAAFEQAVALDPANQALSLVYAYALIDETIPPGLTYIEPGTELPPALARARELFQTATRAAPDAADAWAGLGSTYVYGGGDPAPGIAALEKAYRLMPTRTDVAHNLAELYAENGERGRAQELIEGVLDRSDDPEMRAAGAQILFRADVVEVNALLTKGDNDAAAARLRALVSTAPTPETKAVVEKKLHDLDQFSTQSHTVSQLNAAIVKANAKQYDAALAILEPLAAGGSDPELAVKARDVLAQVRDMQSVDRAVALARGGEFARAAEILRRLARDSKDPQVVKQAKEMLTTVEANRQSAAYNQALAKFQQQDFAGAVAILDRLIAETKDPDLADKARDLRGWAKQGLTSRPAPSR
ncbi:MAG TPA: tetratricopeptide repeat protein [Patescibacteria group bacterium]|nr:tetratricopeptide repeat protein [Patescibacteria group bacterium]